MNINRRRFVKTATFAAVSGMLPNVGISGSSENSKKIRVVVWDERQPKQKEAYDNFLGNQIAEYLQKQSLFLVRSVALDDPEQGLSEGILENCDVLIWWGHARQSEVLPETGRKIVKKIVDGSLAFIALHSAHWSTPFMEAMNEITRRHTGNTNKSRQQEITYIPPPKQYTVPNYDARITPYTVIRKFPDGREKLKVHLPYCCFPAYRSDGKASSVQILKPEHPIVKGIPNQFELPKTEMYDEPFHVPEPDEVILEERWATGEWFRSGMVWSLGKGRVFYYRPGHENYPVYKEPLVLQILSNAVDWLGNKTT